MPTDFYIVSDLYSWHEWGSNYIFARKWTHMQKYPFNNDRWYIKEIILQQLRKKNLELKNFQLVYELGRNNNYQLG